jgi:hypothetical protein
MAADLSGASCAVAIVILGVGMVSMVMRSIFRSREKEKGIEEGLRKGREEGCREMENEFTRADAQHRPGEARQQAVERLRREKAGDE